MGLWLIRKGEFAQAEPYLRNAIARLTEKNPNPYDGEAFYNLGLALKFQEKMMRPTIRSINRVGTRHGKTQATIRWPRFPCPAAIGKKLSKRLKNPFSTTGTICADAI